MCDFTDYTAVFSEHVPNARNERQWCRAGEHAAPLRKKGQPARKIHVYGACTKWGMAGPVYFEGNLNAHKYITVVLPKLLKAIAEIFDRNNDKSRWVLQQDGATPHTADNTQRWLSRRPGLRWWSKHKWPGSSPDLSPIEGMWTILQQFVTPPGCVGLPEDEHRARINHWFSLDHRLICRRAIRGMPVRLEQLAAANFRAFRH